MESRIALILGLRKVFNNVQCNYVKSYFMPNISGIICTYVFIFTRERIENLFINIGVYGSFPKL